jgi:hypothetical protein
MRAVVVALGVTATALLAGCATPGEAPGRELVVVLAREALDRGQVEQYELMKDGEVDREDNDAAFRLMRSCMSDGGVELTDPVVSPADGLRYIYDLVPNGLAPKAIDALQRRCEEQYWTTISSAYADTNPHVMDEALREAALACLDDHGYEMTGDESNFKEMVGDPDSDNGKQRDQAAACIFDAAHELFPDLPSLSLTS